MRPRDAGKAASAPAKPAAGRSSARDASGVRRSRLTFSEERELAALPAAIERLEARIDAIRHRFADPSLYRDAVEEAKALPAELAQVERDLAEAYARWEMLEGRK